MRCPSKERLIAAFPDLTPERAALIRRIAAAHSKPDTSRYDTYWWGLRELIAAKCPKTHARALQCSSDPFDSHLWATTMALEAIDEVLGTFGVEPMGHINARNGPPLEYMNVGDMHATTLVYSRIHRTDYLYIGIPAE